jgi:predicted MFS family arabinose efflux permease
VAAWIREPEREPEVAAAASRSTPTAPEASVFRDRALWRISAASTLLVVPQFTVVTLTVELLHEHRHVPAATAAAVLAVVQIAGAASRIVVGRWSDRAASRTAPLRTLSAAMAVGALLLAASVSGPLLLLEAALVVEGALVICWNGLAYTAAGELAPPAQRGAALAFQNTGNFIAATATPPVMSAVIDAAGFAPGLALLAVPATAAGGLLRRPIAVRS